MRSARLPFKVQASDAAWLTVVALVPETFFDRMRLALGPYRVGWSTLFGRIWYDPRTIGSEEPKR